MSIQDFFVRTLVIVILVHMHHSPRAIILNINAIQSVKYMFDMANP